MSHTASIFRDNARWPSSSSKTFSVRCGGSSSRRHRHCIIRSTCSGVERMAVSSCSTSLASISDNDPQNTRLALKTHDSCGGKDAAGVGRPSHAAPGSYLRACPRSIHLPPALIVTWVADNANASRKRPGSVRSGLILRISRTILYDLTVKSNRRQHSKKRSGNGRGHHAGAQASEGDWADATTTPRALAGTNPCRGPP